MKLVNETELDSAQARAIVLEVAKRELLSKEDVSRLVVTLQYRRRSTGGWSNDQTRCWIPRKGSWKIRMDFVKGEKLDRAQFAKSAAAGMALNQGMKWDRRSSDYGWAEGWREKWAWADAMPLDYAKEEPKVKPAADVALSDRMRHCLAQIVEWERKEKLASTKLKKWRARLKRYSRELGKVIPKTTVEGSGSAQEGLEGGSGGSGQGTGKEDGTEAL